MSVCKPRNALKENGKLNRDEFVAKLKGQLDEMNAAVDELEEKVDAARGDAAREYEKKLDELRAERARAKDKLQEIRDAGDDAWEDLKDEAEHAWKAFRNSVNYFKSHFK
jgi:chromosome segregation ATPase